MKISKLIFFICFNTFLYAQEYKNIVYNDTITYPIKPTLNKINLSVTSNQANLGVDIYENNRKIKSIDESYAVGFPEIIQFRIDKKNSYKLKIYASSFLENSKDYSVSIKSNYENILSKRVNQSHFTEDLKIFKSIRDKANSGLYVYRTKDEIDSIYHWAFKEVNKCNSILDFYKIIVKLTDFEGSCHNGTILPTTIDHFFTTSKLFPPIAFKNLGNKVVANSSKAGIPLGAEVLEINGFGIDEITKRLSKYYHTDGFSKPFKEIFVYEKGFFEKYLIEFGVPNSYTIKYKFLDKVNVIKLSNINKDQYNLIYDNRYSKAYDDKHLKEKYKFELVDKSLYKLSVNGFDFAMNLDSDEYKKYHNFLEESFSFLEKENIQHLIIDLRYNKGGAGFLYEKLYTYLTNRPFRDSFYAYRNFENIPFEEHFIINQYLISNNIFNTNNINIELAKYTPLQGDGKYYISDKKNPLILPNKLNFKGQIYLIIDENTASAAAHLASLIKSYTNAIVIGKETMGGYYEHNGHIPIEYLLPNSKITTRFSILHVIQDAKFLVDQPKGRGVIPHYVIYPSVEEYINQTDVEIEKVKMIIKEKSR